MNHHLKTLAGLVAFAVILGGAVLLYQALSKTIAPQSELQATEEPGALPKEKEETEKTAAPDCKILDQEGNEVKLSELLGKPMVLNFWASWCSPCKSEMPDFQKVYEELGEEVLFVMVNMTDGQRETMEKAKQYVKDQGFTFSVYFDTEQDAAATYGVSSIPTTYFIDREGFLVTGARGAIDEALLRKGIALITEGS